MAIREKALGVEHPNVALSLQNLATIYEVQNRLSEAEQLYLRAIAIQDRAFGSEHPTSAQTRELLAINYTSQGRYADAERLLKLSLATKRKAFGESHPAVAKTLTNLAVVYQRTDRLSDASDAYARALTISEKILGADHPSVAGDLSNLGGAALARKQFEQAERLHKRALTIREQAFGETHPEVATSLSHLADALRMQGKTADALPLVQRAVGIGRVRSVTAFEVMADAERQNLVSADDALDLRLTVMQRVMRTSTASAISKLGARFAAGNDALAQLVRRDQDLSDEAGMLDKAIVAAVSNAPARRNAANEDRIRQRLEAIARERTALQARLAQAFPNYAALSNPQPLTARAIRSLLAPDEALIVFNATDSEHYMVAVTQDGAVSRRLPLNTAAIDQKVAAFRNGLDVDRLNDALAAGRKPELFDLELAHELYRDLLGPAEALIGKHRQLLVVPTGALTALPFHLLVTDKPEAAQTLEDYRNAQWLLKRHAITVLPSVESLKALRGFGGQSPAAKPMIGFADPLFNPTATPAETRKATTAARKLAALLHRLLARRRG